MAKSGLYAMFQSGQSGVSQVLFVEPTWWPSVIRCGVCGRFPKMPIICLDALPALFETDDGVS